MDTASVVKLDASKQDSELFSPLAQLTLDDVNVKQLDQGSSPIASPPMVQHSSEGGTGPTTSNDLMMHLPQHRSISVPGGGVVIGQQILPARGECAAQREAGQKLHKDSFKSLVPHNPSEIDSLYPSIYDAGSDADVALTLRSVCQSSPTERDDSNPFARSNYKAIKSTLTG
jgi:hypothetical protein